MSGPEVVIGSLLTALAAVVCAVIAARAAVQAAAENREAQRAAAGPANTAANLSVLQASIVRLDEENDEIRAEQRGTRALIRAYAWTVDRLIARMQREGFGPEPEDIHELVTEHMRTGA